MESTEDKDIFTGLLTLLRLYMLHYNGDGGRLGGTVGRKVEEFWLVPEMIVRLGNGVCPLRSFATSVLIQFGPLDSNCLLYTSPSPRDGLLSRMPSSA